MAANPFKTQTIYAPERNMDALNSYATPQLDYPAGFFRGSQLYNYIKL